MSPKINHRILLLIGPTAVGKSSLLDRALQDYSELVDIITYTTRPMRRGESEGQPYHFVTDERFQKLIQDQFFVEWANVHGRMYGVPRDQFEQARMQGRGIIMDIDVQGAKTLLKEFPGLTSVFLLPPSIDALRKRFENRGVTSAADLEKRLESAQKEMAQASSFGHVLINDDFEETYLKIRKIVENMLKNQ